tara:strand:- start:5790 stop:6554 length:765 start_codon:yes stop_codon:yes gene_type:complete
VQLKNCLELSKQNKLTFIFILLANFLFAPNLNPENLSKYLLNYPNLDDPDGEVIFNNEYVVLQKLIVGPGEWEGIHSHPGNQIYVHIKGGYWSGRLNGQLDYDREFSPDGSIGWMDSISIDERHDSGNSGDNPIELIYVTLKKEQPINYETEVIPLNYPNINLELLFENERLIVQKIILKPGEWEGPHPHPGNQLWIMITSGIISWKQDGRIIIQNREIPAGKVGWLETDSSDVLYERGNVGVEDIEYIIVTIK